MSRNKGFAVVPVLIIVALVAVAGLTWYSASKYYGKNQGSNSSTTSTDSNPDISNWKTYNYDYNGYGKISFKYPGDWTIEGKEFVTLIPPSSYGVKDRIDFGGRQFRCDLAGITKCLNAFGMPHTYSTNQNILSIFDQIVRSIQPIGASDLQITSPVVAQNWKPGTTHTITWKSKIPSSVKVVSLELLDGNLDGLDSLVWRADNVPDTGSYSITIPMGKNARGNEVTYGPYLLQIHAFGEPYPAYGGITTPGWGSPSGPIYIISDTGKPGFEPMPRG